MTTKWGSEPTLTFPQGQGTLPISRLCAFFKPPTKGRGLVSRSGSAFGRNFKVAMTDQRVSYTMDSTLETVDTAELAAGRMAAEAGFGEDEIMQISMAVREAAVNAVLHGNAYDPA